MSKEHVLDNFLNCFNFIDTENQLTTAYPIFLHLGYTEESAKAVLSEPMIYQYTNKDGFAPQKYAFISIKQIRELIVNAPKSKYISHILNFIDTKLAPLFVKEVAVVELELVPKSDNIKTMSSLEIAELTGKQHAHVMRDIKSMLEQAKISQSNFGSTYLDTQNKERPCYKLDRELTLCLVTGYSVPLRLKIIRRLDELEKQVAQPALPQITPPTPIKEIDRPQPTKQLNASFLKAAIKQIEEMTLSKDSKQVLKAHLLHEQAGLPLELMLPVTYEEKLSPAQIAQQLKVSPQAIGRIITKLGLRGNDDYCEGRLSQSTTSNKEVVMYFYNHQAVQMIKQRLEEKKSA